MDRLLELVFPTHLIKQASPVCKVLLRESRDVDLHSLTPANERTISLSIRETLAYSALFTTNLFTGMEVANVLNWDSLASMISSLTPEEQRKMHDMLNWHLFGKYDASVNLVVLLFKAIRYQLLYLDPRVYTEEKQKFVGALPRHLETYVLRSVVETAKARVQRLTELQRSDSQLFLETIIGTELRREVLSILTEIITDKIGIYKNVPEHETLFQNLQLALLQDCILFYAGFGNRTKSISNRFVVWYPVFPAQFSEYTRDMPVSVFLESLHRFLFDSVDEDWGVARMGRKYTLHIAIGIPRTKKTEVSNYKHMWKDGVKTVAERPSMRQPPRPPGSEVGTGLHWLPSDQIINPKDLLANEIVLDIISDD